MRKAGRRCPCYLRPRVTGDLRVVGRIRPGCQGSGGLTRRLGGVGLLPKGTLVTWGDATRTRGTSWVFG